MNVVHTLPKFLPITESWIYDILNEQKKRNISIQLCTLSRINDKLFPQIASENIYHDTPIMLKGLYKIASWIIGINPSVLYWQAKLKRTKIDIIHNHFGWLAPRTLILAKRIGVPFVTSFYGTDIVSLKYYPNKRLAQYQKQLKDVYKDAGYLICTSDFLRKNLIAQGANEQKIKVIHLGIDCDKFKPPDKKNSKKEIRILCVGRYIKSKGQEYLLQAIAQIAAKMKEVRLTLVGNGDLVSYYKTLAQQLGISQLVYFLEDIPHQDLIKIYQKSDIYVQPSIIADGREEAIGMALVEAAACGLPLVGSNIGGIPEVVKNNLTGILIPEKNVNSLTTAIFKLIDNQSLQLHLSRNARRLALSEFSLEKQVKELVDI